MLGETLIIILIVAAVIVFGTIALVASFYKKIPQGKVIVRTGVGGSKVFFNGGMVVPILHRMEVMDISVQNFEINREGKNGLICKDHLRADIRVAFFVRVNRDNVMDVAQAIGCERASDTSLLINLFEAKFSEALKTVGKQFDFIDLYNSRDELNNMVRKAIGTDLNGYILEDCAIDHLEQTPPSFLDPDNILDSEGIKKITEKTAEQKILANKIRNDEVKTIKKQDVERKEAVLELEKQQSEAEEKQKREIANIRSRENSAASMVEQEERLKAENARIRVDEELEIANQNKERQVIIAQKNKEKVDAVESERLEKERMLEETEREKIVSLAQIAKEKALEEEKRNIQDVIKERIILEKSVVEEQEKIKDTQAFAEAERLKKVSITKAEQEAEEELLKEVKSAEAQRQAAEIKAKQKRIDADADFMIAEKQAEATKVLAKAKVEDEAAQGLAEAKVIESKAQAQELQATADAKTIEETAIAEAKGMEAKAQAIEKQGMAEAKVAQEKALVEAQRIKAEAEANKLLDEAGRDLEEFRLKLQMEKDLEMAKVNVQKDIALAQAQIMSEGLKAANIDIVGGDSMFFEKIIQSITSSKSVDRFVNHSQTVQEIKHNLLDSENGNMLENVKNMIAKFGLTSEDIRNLSVSALLLKLSSYTNDSKEKNMLENLMEHAKNTGLADIPVKTLGI
ncbi:flotillin family protein [Rapidithrix thailandica]|uniref:Flotillin family protein n=1 Tax=Rapidithrix thailandica TaxID=413964 RepID=A0AAW9SGH3_9BACT